MSVVEAKRSGQLLAQFHARNWTELFRVPNVPHAVDKKLTSKERERQVPSLLAGALHALQISPKFRQSMVDTDIDQEAFWSKKPHTNDSPGQAVTYEQEDGTQYRVRFTNTDKKTALHVEKLLAKQSSEGFSDGTLPYAIASIELTVSKTDTHTTESHTTYSDYQFAGNRTSNLRDTHASVDTTRKFLEDAGLTDESQIRLTKALALAGLECEIREYAKRHFRLDEPYITTSITTLFEVMDMSDEQVAEKAEALDNYVRDRSNDRQITIIHEGEMIEDKWRRHKFAEELTDEELRIQLRKDVVQRLAKIKNFEYVSSFGELNSNPNANYKGLYDSDALLSDFLKFGVLDRN